jgi:hypothetical protein
VNVRPVSAVKPKPGNGGIDIEIASDHYVSDRDDKDFTVYQ